MSAYFNSDDTNEIFVPSYVIVETSDCDSLGNPEVTIQENYPKKCSDLAEKGFRFVKTVCAFSRISAAT